MIELINLHTPALASLEHPDRFQAQYKVSFELNAGMVHDLAIQTQEAGIRNRRSQMVRLPGG